MTVRKPDFVTASETSITISYQQDDNQSSSSSVTYSVQYKQPNESWDTAKRQSLPSSSASSSSSNIKYEIDDLEPGTTYCIRIGVVVDNNTKEESYGPELVVDTEQVGCTPGQKSNSCACSIS